MTIGELLSDSSEINNATAFAHMQNLRANNTIIIRPECPGDTLLVLPEDSDCNIDDTLELSYVQDECIDIIQGIEICIVEGTEYVL